MGPYWPVQTRLIHYLESSHYQPGRNPSSPSARPTGKAELTRGIAVEPPSSANQKEIKDAVEGLSWPSQKTTAGAKRSTQKAAEQ